MDKYMKNFLLTFFLLLTFIFLPSLVRAQSSTGSPDWNNAANNNQAPVGVSQGEFVPGPSAYDWNGGATATGVQSSTSVNNGTTAAGYTSKQGTCNGISNVQTNGIRAIIDFLICFIERYLIPVIMSLGLVFFLWGGSQFIRYSENEEKRAEYKNYLVWGVIAIFVMLSFWGLIKLVTGTLGFGDGRTAPIPLLKQDK